MKTTGAHQAEDKEGKERKGDGGGNGQSVGEEKVGGEGNEAGQEVGGEHYKRSLGDLRAGGVSVGDLAGGFFGEKGANAHRESFDKDEDDAGQDHGLSVSLSRGHAGEEADSTDQGVLDPEDEVAENGLLFCPFAAGEEVEEHTTSVAWGTALV